MVSGPTARELLQNRHVTDALREAWANSMLTGGYYQERGGWIYADATNVSKLHIRAAAKDRSKPGKESAAGMAIDLSNPESNPGNPAPDGYKVVANYHTHPLPAGNQEPSVADMQNAYDRGVPGIVVSTNYIWYYGPERRESMNGSKEYPGKNGSYTGQSPTNYGPNTFN